MEFKFLQKGNRYKVVVALSLALLVMLMSKTVTAQTGTVIKKTVTKKPPAPKKVAGSQPVKKPSEKVIPPEYVDIIEVSTTKNSHVDVKGTQPLSVDVGGDKQNILLDIQANSNIVKLKAIKKNFPETNMIIVCKDTVLQFLVRYREMPGKNFYTYTLEGIKERVYEMARNVTPVVGANTTVVSSTQPGSGINGQSTLVIDKNGAAQSAAAGSGSVLLNENDKIAGKWRDSSATYDLKYGSEGKQSLTVEKKVLVPEKSVSTESVPNEKGAVSSGKYLREEVYEKLRAKSVNINLGDLDGGIRVLLDRLYKDQDIYYYALTVYNREKADFLIDYTGFEVHRKAQNQSTNTDILRCYSPKNNPTICTAGSKVSLVFSTDKVEMLPEEFLLITLSGGDKEIKIKLKQVDFERASVVKL